MEKAVHRPLQLPVLPRLGGAGGGGDAVSQLLQGQGQLAAAPLFRLPGLIAVEGQTPGDLPQTGRQPFRPVDGHGVPGPQPGVIDALLGVQPVGEQAEGDGVAVVPVFLPGLGDGVAAALPEQVHDAVVLHRSCSFLERSVHLSSQEKEEKVSSILAQNAENVETAAFTFPKSAHFTDFALKYRRFSVILF